MAHFQNVLIIGLIAVSLLLLVLFTSTNFPLFGISIGKAPLPVSINETEVSLRTGLWNIEDPPSISNPQHWTPDWYYHNDSGVLLSHRKEVISNRCKQLKPYTSALRNVPDLLFIESKRLSVALTAKGGTVFWKGVLPALQQLENGSETTKVEVAVSRNPWHRLVSAWNDKMADRRWMRWMCQGKTWSAIPPFSTFVDECVLALFKHRKCDIHWVPVFDRNRMCKKNYDYYTENMNQEAAYIIEKVSGISNGAEVLAEIRNRTIREHEKGISTSNYQEQYRNVSLDSISKLRELYKHDIFLFGYPDTPFVDFSKA